MTDYIKSCLPPNGKQDIITEISKLKPHQIQELDSWLKKIEANWRKVELLRVTARDDGAFEASIQSGTYFPDI